MGGFGSSRWEFYRPRPIVEESHRLAIGDLLRLGKVEPGKNTARETLCFVNAYGETIASIAVTGRLEGPGGFVVVDYDCQGERQLYYQLPVSTTSVPRGGRRLWFACPQCGDRCRKVFLPREAKRFACRACHRLSYRSQRLAKRDPPAVRRALLARVLA